MRPWVLPAFVAGRLLVPLGVLVSTRDVAGEVLWRSANPHAVAKVAVIAWQSLLRRQDRVAFVLALALAAALVLPRLRGRAWWIGAALFLAASLATVGSLAMPIALAIAALNASSWTLPRWAAWIPGTEIVTPAPLARALGAWPRAVAAVAVPAWVAVWLGTDTLAGFRRYEGELFQPWPARLEDPRVTVVERATPPTKCDYHDVDVVGDRVVVVAEWTNRLFSFPGGATWSLPKMWGPPLGNAMDSETDPKTGITYYMGGLDHLAAARWDGRAWQPAGRSAPFGATIPIAYLRLLGDRLAMLTVNAYSPNEHPLLLTFDVATLQDVRRFPLHTADGKPLPTARDFEWIPPLRRLVVAPDMGRRLYLVNPDDGLAEPWLEVPAMDGKPRWSPELGRLIVPMPTRLELWLVDPVTENVQRIRTQPGVRTADVDVERGLLLTGSVLTGQVLVQRLADGAIVDRYGGLMPMARTLVADTQRGEAWLTTWTTLYRIPYGPD
ncbi:MAG: hypothetical protein ACOZNI_10035 [Myxococcota bacterium]